MQQKKRKFKDLGGDLNGGIFHIFESPSQKWLLPIPSNIAISTRCVLELSEHHVVVWWGVWTQYQVVILLIGGVKPLQGGRSAQPIKDHGLPLAPDNHHHLEYIIPVKKSNTAFFHNGGKEPGRLRSTPTR